MEWVGFLGWLVQKAELQIPLLKATLRRSQGVEPERAKTLGLREVKLIYIYK